uniref:Transcription factor iib n=1 Tax=Bodo saltans TaxID=75058 RepID=B6DTL9_BODSA|nr:transcription factor iib [Bodo saltans]
MMSSVLERPCPYCGAENSLQMDACRGEIACDECGIVVADRLEEAEETRFVKDHTVADASDDTRGGQQGETFARKPAASHHEVNKSLSSQAVTYLRRLQEKSKTSDAVLNDAIELCRVVSVKKRELNERIEKPFAVAAACFQFASQRQHVPISHHELLCIDRSLNPLDIKLKLGEMLRSLNLSPTPAVTLQRDAVRHFLMRLRWNIMLCESAALAIIGALRSLSVEGLDVMDEVVAALLWIKHGADALDALAKHHSEVIKSTQVAELLSSNPTEEATQLEMEGATRFPKARIAEILKTMKRERRAIVEHLSLASPTSTGAVKRPREN